MQKRGLHFGRHAESIALAAPAIAFLVVFALLPFLILFGFSFFSLDLSNPDHFRQFVGLAHYRSLLQGDQSFNAAILRTLQFTAIGVIFEISIGTFFAALIHGFPSRIKTAVVSIAILPMLMAPVAVGLMWLFLLQPDYGLISHFVKRATGFNGALLADPEIALLVVRLIDVWEWTPFVTLVMLAGLSTVPKTVLEAAQVDGLNFTQRFRSVYWPALRGIVLVAVLIRVIEAVKVFDIVYILTGGGPGNATEMASLYLQRLAIRETRFGYASAATVLVNYVVLLLTAAFFRLAYRRQQEERSL
jgi:multiple sugar transport system permease protein